MVCSVFLSLEDHGTIKRKALKVTVKTGDKGDGRARVTYLG